MPDENKDLPNTLKYSIWETRTDAEQMKAKQQIIETIQNVNHNQPFTEKHE